MLQAWLYQQATHHHTMLWAWLYQQATHHHHTMLWAWLYQQTTHQHHTMLQAWLYQQATHHFPNLSLAQFHINKPHITSPICHLHSFTSTSHTSLPQYVTCTVSHQQTTHHHPSASVNLHSVDTEVRCWCLTSRHMARFF